MEFQDSAANIWIKNEIDIKEEPLEIEDYNRDAVSNSTSLQKDLKDLEATSSSQHSNPFHHPEYLDAVQGPGASFFIITELDDVKMTIKEEPPLEIDDNHSSSDLDTSQDSDSTSYQKKLGATSSKDQPKNRKSKPRSRCKLCKKILSTNWNLKLHFKTKHPGLEFDFEYKCHSCDEFLGSKEELLQHSKIAHPEKTNNGRVNARCNVCQGIFSYKSNLVRHFKRDHPIGFELKPDYKCSKCDVFCKTLDDVKIHKIDAHIHEEPSPETYFKKPRDQRVNARCNGCLQVFNRNCKLKEHFRTKHPGLEFEPDYKRRCTIIDENVMILLIIIQELFFKFKFYKNNKNVQIFVFNSNFYLQVTSGNRITPYPEVR